MTIKVHALMAEARAKGYDWDSIDNTLSTEQQHAVNSGMTQLEVARMMGFSDPQLLRDQLEAEAQIKKAWDIG